MQKEFTDKWSDFYQSTSKPITALTELNIDTFNRLAKNTVFIDEIMKAKKPEDVISTQLKLASTFSLEAMKYFQEASNIYLDAASKFSDMFTTAVKESTKTAQSMAKSDYRNKE